MSDLHTIYRHQLIRAVLGTRPAILAKEADTAALDRLCQRLVDAEVAIHLLCSNGCGMPSHALPDLVRALLNNTGTVTA
jgi:hypothetical protein